MRSSVPPSSLPQFTAEQFGLTMTDNCPVITTASTKVNTNLGRSTASTKQTMHKTLNNQTVHQGFQPSVSRKTIVSHLNKNNLSEEKRNEELVTAPDSEIEFMDEADMSEDENASFEPTDLTQAPAAVSVDRKNAAATKMHPVNISSHVSRREDLPVKLQVETELMQLMARHKMPLVCFKEIFQWAMKSQSKRAFDFATLPHARSRKTILKDLKSWLPESDCLKDFHFDLVEWLPDRKPVEVSVRYFKDAVSSLLQNKSIMREENLSFPDSRSPLSSQQYPRVDEMSELHHGSWWSESWDLICKADNNEILVPVILYLDGISVDAHGRLTLTPLNMTLGIFNTATRQLPQAWETIYFHPDHNFQSSHQSSTPSSADNLQNLHNGLRVALKSFKEACKIGIPCTDLPYAQKKWNVTMKFAIAYVIGDTKLHDELCGRYASYQGNVSKICRHCKIPTMHCVNPKEQKLDLWTIDDFRLMPTNDKDYWRGISHHPINNAFDDLEFGCLNTHGIHLATPGECLHMCQLGCTKRAVESFDYFVKNQSEIPGQKIKAKNEIEGMAQSYGAMLSRQSDRDFPRVKFTSSFLSPAKKEGKDYAGILLGLLLALVSEKGRHTLTKNAHATNGSINKLVHTIELILFMEEFLKKGKIKKTKLGALKKFVYHFIKQINNNCQRDGMSTKLIKNHLFFHLVQYIELWGCPRNWDSAASESHHKTEIKAPSQNTQNNASTFIAQTGKRQLEKKILDRLQPVGTAMLSPRTIKPVSGSFFVISRDVENNPTMSWCRKENKNKPHHPQVVLQFICTQLIPHGDTSTRVLGFTEHTRRCRNSDEIHRFRCHPCYRSESGQVTDCWYDWSQVTFLNEDTNEKYDVPCQILCFLDLKENDSLSFSPEPDGGPYAIIRSFRQAPKKVQNSTSMILLEGTVYDDLLLVPCDSIADTVAVVQHKTVPETNNRFFVVQNRTAWLATFFDQLDSQHR